MSGRKIRDMRQSLKADRFGNLKQQPPTSIAVQWLPKKSLRKGKITGKGEKKGVK
jgi:hypothetical protein